MHPKVLGAYLAVVQDVVIGLERAAYLHERLHPTAAKLTEARGVLQEARHALPGRRPAPEVSPPVESPQRPQRATPQDTRRAPRR